ncbi:hypothetical protein PB2503_13514 [Parvularcula bermudensis HTCC2503]|uniref:Probable inorganic carbon transporter subunit DabA n=1 Tax=Parvularcula bermudensis (strain ATCC BAA-594 / HTCC2503 / KCTC 12087) TaxID=314260 RepID=E0THE8_PARBH|nr:DUF2309 domain-containing protein [Parvularcula bermudensis]ADM10740.1 hypothetical protein PB2503_13514 [Parvularcula bermudensis HTCC2503]
MNSELSIKDHLRLTSASDVYPDPRLMEAITIAHRVVAPVWPLNDFVAVNPALNFGDQPFGDGAGTLQAATGGRFMLSKGDLATAAADGRIPSQYVAMALEDLGLATRYAVDDIMQSLLSKESEDALAFWPSVADLARATGEKPWADFVTDQISSWAASYFPDNSAAVKAPWGTHPPFAAWRRYSQRDREPGFMGLKGFRQWAGTLDEDPLTLLTTVMERLNLPPSYLSPYFSRLLGSIRGWAGHARYREWHGDVPVAHSMVTALLAIRAAYDLALFELLPNERAADPWTMFLNRSEEPQRMSVDDAVLVAQTALELAEQDNFIAQLRDQRAIVRDVPRPSIQAVFCIDVRSERLRHAVEAEDPLAQTYGFAGFFGVPLSVLTKTAERRDHCPVLLSPTLHCTHTAHSPQYGEAASAWSGFRSGVVSAFAFVESFGLGAGASILKALSHRKAAPALPSVGNPDPLPPVDERTDLALRILKGMSLGDNLARLVLLVGHDATTENNPYAAGLACGACGGHSGAPNAVIAARILNDPEVRTRLADRGVALPSDTRFLAALHDTTTDDITFLPEPLWPESHVTDLDKAKAVFSAAGAATRRARAHGLGLTGKTVEPQIRRRSRDWSEIRPEWGLAGCNAFIAAPRARTYGMDLEGRAFLHSYDHTTDTEGGILELIMTAPLIVASWISYQYYASSIDNETFGSGDKTLHNNIGDIGVLEGASGDLRVGLPIQSVHDGMRLRHEPTRLRALIEAPTEAIDAVFDKHPDVKALFDHGWLHLTAIIDQGAAFYRYQPGGRWIETGAATPAVFAARAAE